MSEPIGVGDWVECVEGGAHPATGYVIAAGAVYRIKRLFRWTPRGCTLHGPLCEAAGVDLEHDGRVEGRDPCWCSARFRKIYRPKASIIEALKAPVTRTPQVVKPIREDA